MSLDLGELGGLASALGLLDDGGNLVTDWFQKPGDYLSSVLRDAHQRESLVSFVDDVLGGQEASTDSNGRQWLPLVTVEDGAFSAYAVLDAGGSSVVTGVGARVRVTSGSGVACSVDAHLPLFAQPVAGGDVQVVPGTAGAFVDASLALTFPPGTQSQGVALAGVSLDVGVPTWPGGEPRFGLVLQGLRLPGTAAASDVTVQADRLDELGDALVGLVLGLLRAQAAGLATNEPLRGLAGLLGLLPDAVPDFPLDDLLARGAVALVDWLSAVVGDDAVRPVWLGGLATLIGGTVQGSGAAAHVVVTLAPATLSIGVNATPGASGRPVVTPSLTLDVAGTSGVTLALEVDPVSIDLGSGTAVAVPTLSLTARVTGAGATPLLVPTGTGLARVGVAELRAGFALDPARRPVLVVQARDADVGATHFDVLDLTSPQALAGAAGQVLTDAAGSLLAGLGPAGDAIATILGIPLPTGPALPTVDPARLLTDPIGAVADRWQQLLAGPAQDVRTVLEAVRDLIADTAAQAVPVTGTGTADDPWRVPLVDGVALTARHVDGVLSCGVSVEVAVDDLAGSGVAVAVVVDTVLVGLTLGAGGVPRSASFLPAARGLLRFTASGGGPLAVGAPPTEVSADALGLGLEWLAGTGVTVRPVLTNARLALGGGGIDLPVPVVDADGRLTLDDAGWAALETLAGAAAEAAATAAGVPWVAELVRLLGWSPSVGGGPGGGSLTAGPRLSLAGLVADPAAELSGYVGQLLDVASGSLSVATVLDLLARLLGPDAGRYGGGSPRDPWRLPLLGAATDALADAVPALIASLGPDGPQPGSTLLGSPLYGWQPGDPPLASALLVSALSAEAAHDDVLADLVTGRENLLDGLEELVARWTGTDGLVALPDGVLPAGVTGHRLSDVAYGTPLDALDLTAVVGAPPATVVYVAVDGTVLPSGVAADHTIDLTGSGLPPEAFTVTLPADPTGTWTVTLGTRTACRLTGGSDPDGVLGQAARLRQVLTQVSGAGPTLVVAHGGAGHPAVRAAAGLAGVTAVVTVGTAWSTLSVDTLDRLPAGEALRLLVALLPAQDAEEPDDEDLATARRVLATWQALDDLGDPLAELRPPLAPTPVAGVTVHAAVGALGEAAVRRAITATVVTGLVERAWARADSPPALPELTRWGLRWPILPPTTRAGVTAALTVDLDLAGTADRSSTDPGPALVVRLSLSGSGGWLLGGPDPGRAPGVARPLGLRRLTARVDLPLGGGAASTRLDLHDATALGVRKSRWTVASGPGAPADATPALPEVRALLGGAVARLTAAATGDPLLTGLLDALTAVGLVGTDGGVDDVTLDRLLLDAPGMAAAVRTDAGRRNALAAALRAVAGDARDAATAAAGVDWTFTAGGTRVDVALDLAAPSVSLRAGGTGALGWSVTGALTGSTPSLSLRLGPDLPEPLSSAAADPLATPAAALLLALQPLSAALRVARPGRVEDVPLWPTPSADALARALADVGPAALARTLLDVLRGALVDAAPAPAQALDALLDALGLLAPAPPADPTLDPSQAPPRPLRLPVGLLTDPSAWLRALPAASGPAGLAAVVPGLLDALRGLLGASGGAGRLEVAGGVAVTATAAGGLLRLGVDVDGTAFAGSGDADRLVLGGHAGLAVSATGVLPEVSVTGGVDGVGGVRLGVAADSTGTVGVRLALQPDGGVEIPLLPAGPGLGGAISSAAAAAGVRALPHLLDEVASHDPGGAPTTPVEVAGRLVARLGDALALRTGAPAAFDADALAAFGHDPAGALAARAAALAAAGLDPLLQAVGPLLGSPGTRSVTATGGALAVTVGPVQVRWTPGTATIGATVTATGLPGVASVTASVDVDAAGLLALDVAVGPAELDADVVVLRPYARVRAGSAPPGGRAVEVGLGVGTDRLLVAQWALDPTAFTLLSRTGGTTPSESTAPADVVLAVVAAVVDLAGAFVLAIPEVATALDQPLLGVTARGLLADVLLDGSDTTRLDPDLLDPDRLLGRVGQLLDNLAAAPGAVVTVDDALTLGPHATDLGGGRIAYGLTLGLAKPFALGGGDITVSMEQLTTWIKDPSGPVAGGLSVDLLTVDGSGQVEFHPGLAVGGLGLRLARTSGPLLDTVLTIEEVAVHVYADVQVSTSGDVQLSGGGRLELGGLSVGLGGATGGTNPVASGMLASGSGEESPKPRFSPALAVQKHGTGDVLVTLSAGDGVGPWWVVVQKGFGPIYVEQVGFAVTMAQDTLGSVGLLIDGSVSLLGLTASVDDLSITYLVSAGSPLSADAWAVDLAGLAVTADIAGVVLAGGLRKFPSAAGGTEYLGMLMARVAVYGLSVYGGFGVVGPDGDQFASLFLFGAVNGPIGGPPAFFVTGIGGGFGINRGLIYPSDLSQFGTYPFIKALDPSARPGDPMAELEQVRGFFPAERGSFWFAAGLSFTSFALVQGVAVVAVQIGDGFELALLGLARMALPRPEAALVSVELGLLARVSTKEGVVLVQAQLTDNSWLLFPSIRLTGGFAFASWFGGPNKGQFVLTLGGYHPSFHRDGYPVVPRLGIAVDLYGFLSITGQAYFALTSEAVMAGARIEASASFGPAWAHLVLGADGIVYFDPFWLDVTVYASISAGVTIDVWIGEITISVSLSARVELTGPPFHGRATFSVGPVDLAVEFGDEGGQPLPIDWDTFVGKYLETAGPHTAHVLAAVPGKGAVPPSGSADTGGAKSPDGSDERPFLVVPEFELTITSTAPVRELVVAAVPTDLPTVPEVSAAPMRQPAHPTVTVTFVGPSHHDTIDRADKLTFEALKQGAFAIGTWGPAQDLDNKKVPGGDVLPAVDRIVLRTTVAIADGTGAIEYRQVEVDPYHRRRPLPFVTEGALARRRQLARGAEKLASTIPSLDGRTVVEVAAALLADRALRSPSDVAAWVGGRAAPPLLGSLGEGLGRAAAPAAVVQVAPEPPPPPAVPRPPLVAAVLAAPVLDVVADRVGVDRSGRAVRDPAAAPGLGRTTVSQKLLDQAGPVVRTAPPRLADVDARTSAAVPARLLRVAPPAAGVAGTVLPARAVPPTRSGRSGVEAVAGRGAGATTTARLRGLTEQLLGPDPARRRGRRRATRGAPGLPVAAGEVHVLALPDADRDVDAAHRPVLLVQAGLVRAVLLGPAGRVLADTPLGKGTTLPVPPGTRRVALVGLGDGSSPTVGGPDLLGWATDAPLPYLGGEVLLGRDVVIRSAARVPSRRFAQVRTGWVAPDVLVGGTSAVVTEFARPPVVVAVAMEGGAGDDLALGIDGADRPTGADGRPAPPVLVADGPRAVAVFDVLPRDGERVVVTVSSGPARRVVGVAGALGVTAKAAGHRVRRPRLPDRHPRPGAARDRDRHRRLEGALMADVLPPGTFRLVPFVEPPVPAGSYLLTGEVTQLPGEVEPLRSRVEIESPRYAMPPDQILSTFPPAGARGSFTSRLPQVVLRRRTLPWERSDDLDGDVSTTPTPWLALVLIAEGEGQLLTDVPVADCVTPGVDLGADADVPKGTCLEVPDSVVAKVFPTLADLPLLCHVRQVDIADTELVMGDDDGWLAVVMGNRLPQPGVRYLACLVNLEGQYDALPEIPDIELRFSYRPVDRVADIRRTYAAADVPVDNVLMGLPISSQAAAKDTGPGARATAAAAASGIVSAASGAAATTGAAWASKSQAPFVTVAADSGRSAKLALADGFAIGLLLDQTLRFPVLAYWSFTCEERGDFQYLATNVHVRMLGHVVTGTETPDGDPIGPEHPVAPGNTAQPGVTRELPLVTQTGHVSLDHVSRRGEAAPAWFRGPLVPAAVPRSTAPPPPDPQPGDPPPPPPLAHHADQLRRVVPDGHEDLGYSAAFEIGRLLALSQPGVVAALARWRQEAFGAARVQTVVADATAALPAGIRGTFATADPLVLDAAAGLRAQTVGARAARAMVAALGSDPQAAMGPVRPVADAGAAATYLAKILKKGDAAVAAGLGVDAPTDADPVTLLAAVDAAPVRVAAADPTVETAVLRGALEDAAGALAADALPHAPGATGPATTGRPRADALDRLIEQRTQGDGR